MRIVVQRVSEAKVEVDGRIVGAIDRGLLVYLSVTHADTERDADFIADKIVNLRIFPDADGKMNLSVQDIAGQILLISQFTLHGDCRKGRRPAFDLAAPPDHARKLYELAIDLIRRQGIPVETGVFAAHMRVASLNDGPVTVLLDSSRLF
jgi:D-aminoacyl-tRNA deacylase